MFLPNKIQAQGIGPPAGMGSMLIVGLLAFVVIAVIVIFSFIFLYKRVKSKKLFLIVISVLVLIIGGWAKGYISFTSYKITNNNPLENQIKIEEQHDGHYFKLADGRFIKFSKKYNYNYTSVNARFTEGKDIMLVDNDVNDELTMYSIANSSEYYNYQRQNENVWLTIPVLTVKIDKNVKSYEGILHELKPDWQADER